jgi:hypothetical protein
LVLGVAVLLAGPTPAQQRRGGPGGFGPGAMLQNPDVQKELKISDEQKEKIQAASKKVNDKYADDRAKLRDAPQEERFEKMRELNQKVSADLDKELADILKPEQIKRYKQLQVQQRGLQAFNDPEVQKALKLTDDQKDKLKTIGEDARKEMAGLREEFQSNREGAMKKMTMIRKESMDKAISVLSDEQKTAWKDMTGAPFEFRFPGGGRRGGGGQGRGRAPAADK